MDAEIKRKRWNILYKLHYKIEEEEILSLYSNKKFDYSLGGYSHRER
jgi:hypothetical protein